MGCEREVQGASHPLLGLRRGRPLVSGEEGSQARLSVLVRNAARNMRRRAFRARPHDALDDHLDLADDPRPWSPEERVRRGYPGHAFARFVVADPAEIPAQPALWQMLTTRCAPTLRDARLAVFACEGLRP